ncbi:hypothetical protein IVB22_10475 [Bradyrhizobium sp. 190]|uniref:hypothetical protein n=1 Tax=Bradyrhizobium sp. 190 TaxID=2782658 RepID=UPI001FFA39C1|nr:hypothetical protein [Bradyrhizobium sp. 190]MCK1512994.1 hypothetical protein [Bradyrhizobium sp. 190]
MSVLLGGSGHFTIDLRCPIGAANSGINKPAGNWPSYPRNLRNPERLAEAQSLAAIALQARQSLWRTRNSGPLFHHGARIQPERKDDLEKHPCDRTRFCVLVRNVWLCSQDG